MAGVLTIALLSWGAEHDYRLADLGPLAAFLVVEAAVIVLINLAVRTR
jgi:hypothetical protein